MYQDKEIQQLKNRIEPLQLKIREVNEQKHKLRKKMQKVNGKYRTQLKCINCGKKFGDFTIGKASETLPICDECRKTRIPRKFVV